MEKKLNSESKEKDEKKAIEEVDKKTRTSSGDGDTINPPPKEDVP